MPCFWKQCWRTVGGVILAVGAVVAHGSTPAAAEDDSDFKPLVEAPVPEGFPSYTPVGEVQIKQYPKYRMAMVESKRGDGFWKLFMHIKTNNIAMTAPVEMEYASGDGELKQQSMAFLYRKDSLGKVGKRGSVQVTDVPAMTAVSIGVRGRRTKETMETAHKRLTDWLVENKDIYEVAGPPRALGYNSPMVPDRKKYFEVQIPVKKVDG